MRTAILFSLALLAIAFATPAGAETVGVGDCQKFGGACAAVCVEADNSCWGDRGTVCFGVSYQVPQCIDLR